jgi:Ca2+/Na+ antiporter
MAKTESESVDLARAEAAYIDLQPAFRLLPAMILSFLLLSLYVDALIFYHGFSVSSEYGDVRSNSALKLNLMTAVLFALLLYFIARRLWRLSRPLGCLLLATGLLSVVGPVWFLGNPAIFMSWAVVFSALICLPTLIMGWYCIRLGYRLIVRDAASRYLCAEVTGGPLQRQSLLAGVAVPTSILNGGRRGIAALFLFVCSSLAVAVAVLAALAFYSAVTATLGLSVAPPQFDHDLQKFRSQMTWYIPIFILAFFLAIWAAGMLRQWGRSRIRF